MFNDQRRSQKSGSTHSTPPLVAHGTTSTTGPSFAPPPPVHHHRPCISLSPNTVHEICQAGFKIHHNYVEDFSLGAWQALRNTWKGVSKFLYNPRSLMEIEQFYLSRLEDVSLPNMSKRYFDS
ncbi:hypothetical protein LguiB_033692 [Lonicera macranthoides]